MNKANVVLFTFIKSNAINAVLGSIHEYNPEKLYIISDLPRNELDKECQKIINNTIESFKGKINIVKITPPTHMGISKIVDFGLDTIFKTEEQLIILEDDTIPSSTFFEFCNMSLHHYQEDKSISSIMGTNLLPNQFHTGAFTSKFGFPYWGWATWKSKWVNMPKSDDFFELHLSDDARLNEILQTFYGTKGMNISWDVRWSIYQYINNLRVLLPDVNLVSNDGFNQMATFTKNENSVFKGLPAITLSSTMNCGIINNRQAELETEYLNGIHYFLNEFKNN
ncbi:MAG: hypothetical protein ACK566_04590 [Bacteroidota bacterium]